MTEPRSSHTQTGGKKTPEPAPERGPAQDRLKPLEGRWAGEGRTADGQRMVVTEEHAFIEGGFFLHSQFEQRIGETRHVGVSAYGWDAAKGGYVGHFFDNLGYVRVYDIEIQDGRWTITGDFERATLTFDEGGSMLTEQWQQSSDGVEFKPLCEFTLRRQGGLH